MLLIFFLHVAFGTLTLNEELEIELSASQVSGKDFESSMTVNGVEYQTICDCTDPELATEQTVKCAPTNIVITQEREGEGATLDDLEEKFSSETYEWVNVLDSSFRCLDGRITEGSLGAPGGDFGEFALALLVYEDMSGKRVDEDSIRVYFLEYLDWMDQEYFYWCTDDDAVGSVEKQIGVEGIDITNPREGLQSSLLTYLNQPNGVGDLHIKNLIESPELYSARIEAIEHFITVFYKVLWDKDDYHNEKIYLEVFPGSHNETAFVEIRAYEDCIVQQVAPLVIPRNGDADNLSIFVNHAFGTSTKRQQISKFFVDKVARNQDGITVDKFLSRMNHHGLLFLDVTGELIAEKLPFYTVAFEN
ncbi:unnamed protein product [Blepharisma stoltei]|uniref:Uncharacterized protein n=1 Tax=Blepharisma stoltei TaxID=1481888 RepID=A0AAU9IDK4_9CILI|nr:unnamed protein product [Blepharisma stoltei]